VGTGEKNGLQSGRREERKDKTRGQTHCPRSKKIQETAKRSERREGATMKIGCSNRCHLLLKRKKKGGERCSSTGNRETLPTWGSDPFLSPCEGEKRGDKTRGKRTQNYQVIGIRNAIKRILMPCGGEKEGGSCQAEVVVNSTERGGKKKGESSQSKKGENVVSRRGLVGKEGEKIKKKTGMEKGEGTG